MRLCVCARGEKFLLLSILVVLPICSAVTKISFSFVRQAHSRLGFITYEKLGHFGVLLFHYYKSVQSLKKLLNVCRRTLKGYENALKNLLKEKTNRSFAKINKIIIYFSFGAFRFVQVINKTSPKKYNLFH